MRKSLLLCLLVAGCQTAAGNPPAASLSDAEAFARARAALLANLKDPDSAKIGSMRRVGNYVCGQVNAKNGFGGYNGAKQFSVAMNDGDVFVQIDGGLPPGVCWSS